MAVDKTGSHVGPQNKTGHPAHSYTQLMQVPVLCARGIEIGSKTCGIVFLGLRSDIVDITLSSRERLVCSLKYQVCCVNFVCEIFDGVVVLEKETCV